MPGLDVIWFETSFLAFPKSYRRRWLFGIILAIVHGNTEWLFAIIPQYFLTQLILFRFLQHEYKDGATSKDKKNKKRKKDKDSDAEDEPAASSLEPSTIANIKENFTGSVTTNTAENSADSEPLPTVTAKSDEPFAQDDDVQEIKK